MKFIQKKSAATIPPVNGSVSDTLNVNDTITNAPSIRLVLELISSGGGSTGEGGFTETIIQSIVNTAKLASHPIGSYYWSEDSTEPSILFGGTWERVKDKFIFALGDSGNAGDTGGSETHSHTQASETGSTTLTADQSGLPDHKHAVKYDGTYPISGNKSATTDYNNDERSIDINVKDTSSSSHLSAIDSGSKNAKEGHTHSLGSTDSASSLPPFEKAYCWKRIA